ncbi:MAG TPA: DUF4332 domain-containing protein, partial [Pirellula sp.]|nr:DUF4332 domain-containing protein [Pirellula sp.]
QELLRGANEFEIRRIRNWIADMRKSHINRSREEVVPIGSDRNRIRNRANPVRRDSSYDARPRIVRSNERRSESDRTAQLNVAGQKATDYSTPAISTNSRGQRTNSSRPSSTSRSGTVETASQWKFYLDVDSPVVEAPSIGPRMAERLSPMNILTVADLVSVNAEEVAQQLADRTVSAEVVRQWQSQALFVCRVPNLRGHDAQLIVGCGVTSAEQLASSDSAELYSKVVRFSSSKAGVRILRGSNAPDQQEVSDWIQWAQNCRAVRAA